MLSKSQVQSGHDDIIRAVVAPRAFTFAEAVSTLRIILAYIAVSSETVIVSSVTLVLKKTIKEKSDITLAEIPYPKFSEARHTIITGTTGAGKSNAIIELIDQVKAKGERLIIVDTVGTFVEKYYQDGDIILNPLDPRSVQWSFLSECNDEILLKNVAACLIGRSDTHDKFWEDAVRTDIKRRKNPCFSKCHHAKRLAIYFAKKTKNT
ncbi:hypothetical protein FACS1894122_12470 [Alphaproteobacteria bacterium]|nr:hypothetical protein FACS1894122_12470 [Alphaproteobacteria bacterium]